MREKEYLNVIKLLMAISLLLMIAFICKPTSRDGCGNVVITCKDKGTSYTVCNGCYLVSQSVTKGIRYFKFYDCALKQHLQSSVDAACTVK